MLQIHHYMGNLKFLHIANRKNGYKNHCYIDPDCYIMNSAENSLWTENYSLHKFLSNRWYASFSLLLLRKHPLVLNNTWYCPSSKSPPQYWECNNGMSRLHEPIWSLEVMHDLVNIYVYIIDWDQSALVRKRSIPWSQSFGSFDVDKQWFPTSWQVKDDIFVFSMF